MAIFLRLATRHFQNLCHGNIDHAHDLGANAEIDMAEIDMVGDHAIRELFARDGIHVY